MKKKVLYLLCMIIFAGMLSCSANKESEEVVNDSMETAETIIDEAAVDSIETKIDELEKEIDGVLEGI